MYALNIDNSGRILSATFAQYAPAGAVIVTALPEGDITEYLYVDGKYIHDPLPVEPVVVEPSTDDILSVLLGVY